VIHLERNRKVFLVIVYGIIFLFSFFAIFQIRLQANSIKTYDFEGYFKVFFYQSRLLYHDEFIMLKMTLFFLVASLSFILMMFNYFELQRKKLEDAVDTGIKEELKKERKKKK
jgi:hypothetical protein